VKISPSTAIAAFAGTSTTTVSTTARHFQMMMISNTNKQQKMNDLRQQNKCF